MIKKNGVPCLRKEYDKSMGPKLHETYHIFFFIKNKPRICHGIVERDNSIFFHYYLFTFCVKNISWKGIRICCFVPITFSTLPFLCQKLISPIKYRVYFMQSCVGKAFYCFGFSTKMLSSV